jgi:Tol biopolymer transport system component
MTPRIFAPGIVSTKAWECAGTFSPDGKEFFFTRRPTWEGSDNRIYHTRELNGRWTKPTLAPFAKEVMEYEPSFTPDGQSVCFTSKRANPTSLK